MYSKRFVEYLGRPSPVVGLGNNVQIQALVHGEIEFHWAGVDDETIPLVYYIPCVMSGGGERGC